MDSPGKLNRRTLLAAAGATAAGGVLVNTGTAHADATVRVDPAADQGGWEGWGTSLAWWANVFGDQDDFADLFFTTKTVPYNGAALPGLGLNIARYNLGACSWNAVNGQRMAVSPNIPRFKQIEGFWQDSHSEDPASWNWDADAKQRAMLTKATQRGAISELFANSPMWWMCRNRNPSGSASGGNNLPAGNHRRHALHLAATARHAQDHWGVNFRTVASFNEPSSNWWKADGKQEGCHIDATSQRSVIANLRTELDRLSLSSVAISSSDETNYDLARTTWASFDTGVDYAVAAHDPATGRLVIVAANTGSAQTLTFDLSRFGTVTNGTATRWSTLTAGSGDRHTLRQDITVSGKLIRVPIAASAVQTIQLEGVTR